MQKDKIKPFIIMKHDDCCSLFLNQEDFNSEVFRFIKNEYKNGYDYENVIRSYVEMKLPHLMNQLNYDSEAGMFCVYCEHKKELEELANSFLNDVKNEKEMVKLLPYMKEQSSYSY